MRFSTHAFVRPSVLPVLAHLMLRNHHELATLFGTSAASTPAGRRALNLEFGSGGLTARLHVPEASNTLSLSMVEGSRAFSVKIPLALREGKLAPVEVTWAQAGEEPQTTHLSASEFLSLEAPAEFKELHARLSSYLQSVLPVALLQKLGMGKAQGGQSSDEASAAAAPETPNSDRPAAGEQKSSAPASPEADPEADSDASDESKPASTQPLCEQKPDPFQPVRLSRANLCDLEFDGRLLAQVASPLQHGRQFVLRVFETRGGKFVATRTGVSLWIGEHTKAETAVYDTLQDVPKLLGFSPLAKHLYGALGLNTAQRID